MKIRNKRLDEVQKDSKKSSMRGITLIALVVTIVVLLILAATSIGMLGGENGIIKQAVNTKDETKIAEETENIEISYISASLEKINQEDKTVYADNLQAELVKLLGENKTECTDSEGESGNEIKVTFVDTKNKYIVDNKGNVTHKKTIDYPTFATETTSANYGNYVNYNIDYDSDGDTSDDWRIFYNDGECIYLIASDYVYLDEYSSAYGGYASLNLLSLGYTTPNDAIEFLLNTDNWTSLIDTESNVVEYVYGTPNIELYVKSWNSVYPDDLIIINKSNDGVTIDGMSDSGYYAPSSSGSDLYCLSQGTPPYGLTQYMWLASKIDGATNLLKQNSSGNIVNCGTLAGGAQGWAWDGTYTGIRPIVCLKPEVILKSGEGTIESPFEIGLK